MMADPIRVGIVGATVTVGGSGWGIRAHVPALRSLPGYVLKAVCTAHEATAQASAKAFGAELAFANFDQMLAHPDIDLIAIVVRVPSHHDLVTRALRAGKATFCEWPLATNLPEAEDLANIARASGLSTLVGLQARSDPTVRAARELLAGDYVGDPLVANLTVISSGQYTRNTARLWQSDRTKGHNPLTVAGGHAMDVARYLLGDFIELAARVSTQTPHWINSDTNTTIDADAPDVINVVARTQNGAEVVMQIASVPTAASGFKLEIYGTKGRLVVLSSGGNVTTGPNRLLGAQGKDDLTELPIPERLTVVPESLESELYGRNVAQAYVRFAQDRAAGRRIDPDFEVGLEMHRVIDAVERAAKV